MCANRSSAWTLFDESKILMGSSEAKLSGYDAELCSATPIVRLE